MIVNGVKIERPFDKDTFDYSNGLSQCISGAGRNGKLFFQEFRERFFLDAYDKLSDEDKEEYNARVGQIDFYFDEFVRWTQEFNVELHDANEKLTALEAEIATGKLFPKQEAA